MSLAGAASSVVRLLERRFATLPSGENPAEGWTIRAVCPAELTEAMSDQVTIFVYRVDLDPTRRHDQLPPETLGGPARVALAVELKFLLIVWGKDSRRELQVLGRCMEFLDETPVIAGDDLAPAYAWLPGAAVKIGIDAISTGDLVQLWDALTPSYRLSVPYHARTLRLRPREAEPAVPHVNTVNRAIGPAGGGR